MKWSEELRVTQEELFAAIKRMASRGDVTPGPDGIPGRVWAELMKTLAPHLQSLFTRYLREGSIPRDVENGDVDPAEQGRTPFGLTVRV
jgi:hypothetical protein